VIDLEYMIFVIEMRGACMTSEFRPGSLTHAAQKEPVSGCMPYLIMRKSKYSTEKEAEKISIK
jgi:hypothetical protein